MSQAVIQGKISRSGSNLTSSSEDLLTGSIFGLLRYISSENLLIPILEKSKTSEREKLKIGSSDDPKFYFWPQYEFSEPDVVIEFPDHLIFIEAKFYSGKSGNYNLADSAEDEEQQEAEAQDQLVREFRDLQERAKKRFSLIYLTAHRILPKKDLEESFQATQGVDEISKAVFIKNTYWLSWFDIWSYVTNESKYDGYQRLIIEDIRLYLEKLGLKHFTGFPLSKEYPVNRIEAPIFYVK